MSPSPVYHLFMAALDIGSVRLPTNLLLCPIAGYCDLAFRLSIRPLGGLALASTDLINPKGVLRQTLRTQQLTETDPDDAPLSMQLYGCDGDEMSAAAQWAVEHGAVIIDINMGCPVDKVCKRDGGSALLRDPTRAAGLARQVVAAVRVPVTTKMRLGWDESSIVAPTLARALEDAGVAAITVHGRTASQKFGGRVNHDGIRRVVEAVRSIPIIGNGDIKTPQDARHMMEATGCCAVMIGRAALADPWIFKQTHAFLTTGMVLPGPTRVERLAFVQTHFEHLMRIRGEVTACKLFRQRISWYIRNLGRAGDYHERVRTMQDAADFRRATAEFLERMDVEDTDTHRTHDERSQPVRYAHASL